MPPRLSLRRAALLVGCAFAVHELRFVLTYGHDAGKVLTEAGHEYIPFAGAAATVLLLLAGSQFGRALLRASRGCVPPQRRAERVRRLWAGNAAALVGIYVAQETLEGAFATGHPVFAHGGWLVVPLAIAFGLLAALLLAGADRALAAAARRSGTSHPTAAPAPVWRGAPALPALGGIARHLAGRGPPAAPAPAN